MSETTVPPAEPGPTTSISPTPGGRPKHRRGRGRRIFFGALGIGLLAVLTMGAFRAFGGTRHSLLWRGHLTAEQLDTRIDRLTTWVMDDLKGTPEQRQKVAEIAKTAAHDLAPVHKELRANHEKVVEILTAEKIDRAALEALRARQLELFTTASKRLTQAVADAGDVLTPDQRVELVDRARSLHGH